jgi:hypothetical protein
MFLSGIILYFKPEGSIARWLDWEILFLDKEVWESLHTIFSFVFLLFALLHILQIHLPNLAIYLNTKSQKTYRELYFSLVISILFLFGTAFSLKPFHYVYQAGDYLSESWKEFSQPPNDKIEAGTSLRKLAEYHGFSSSKVKTALEEKGLVISSLSQTLIEVGNMNNMAPYKVHEVFTELDLEPVSKDFYYEDEITLSQLAFIFEVNQKEFISLLKEKLSHDNISEKTTLKELASKQRKSLAEIREEMFLYVNQLSVKQIEE